MSTDKSEREAFEAWIRTGAGHPYAGQFANLMWAAWQARAAQPSQPATVVPVADEQIVRLAYQHLTTWDQDHIRFARAVLALAHPSAPAESGWQWVPVEPTEEMIDALHDEIEHEVQTGMDQDGNYAEVSVLDAATLPAAYRAMLKAAPSAAQPGGEGGARG